MHTILVSVVQESWELWLGNVGSKTLIRLQAGNLTISRGNNLTVGKAPIYKLRLLSDFCYSWSFVWKNLVPQKLLDTSFLHHTVHYTKPSTGSILAEKNVTLFSQQMSSTKEKMHTEKIEVIFLSLTWKWHTITSNCTNRSICSVQTQGEMIVQGTNIRSSSHRKHLRSCLPSLFPHER